MRSFPPDPKSDEPVHMASDEFPSSDTSEAREVLRQDLARRGIPREWVAGPADTDVVTSDEIAAAFAVLRSQVLEPSLQSSREVANSKVPHGIERLHGRGRLRTQPLRYGVWSLAAAMGVAGIMMIVRTGATKDSGTATTYATHAGQQATVTLRDGTHVTLSPNTNVRLVQAGAQARTVVVDGEAYFDVAQSSRVPFAVQAGSVTARVLGTGFMVRYRQGDRHVRVAVSEGKVMVTSRTARWTGVPMAEGAVGEFGDSVVHVGSIGDLAPGAEWRGGKLLFRDTPVAVVLQVLGRWYGYQFQCPDASLARQDVTIALNMRSSSAALATLEGILSVNLTIAGDTITLMPQHAQKTQAMPRMRTYDVWIPTKEAGR